jgi:hypothetical protein
VLIGAGTDTITKVAPGTAGFVLTSNGPAADPSFKSVSSSGAIITITGNSGGAEVPDGAGNFNLLGTGSITIVGSLNTETVQLTGLTNHALQIGAGTATLTQLGSGTTGQVLQTNTGADPTWSIPTYPSASGSAGVILRSDGTNNIYTTATYPATTTINQILYSSANNTITGLATANRAVLTTGATGIPVLTALATDGQLIIGSTAGVPAAATLTAGAGISISNGSNSITIAAVGSGINWQVIGASQTLAISNGYFCTTGGALSLALPAVSAVGDTIEVVLDGSTSWTITQPNAATRIRIGNQQTTLGVGGSLASTAVGDWVELVCETANARWCCAIKSGNITVV